MLFPIDYCFNSCLIIDLKVHIYLLYCSSALLYRLFDDSCSSLNKFIICDQYSFNPFQLNKSLLYPPFVSRTFINLSPVCMCVSGVHVCVLSVLYADCLHCSFIEKKATNFAFGHWHWLWLWHQLQLQLQLVGR